MKTFLTVIEEFHAAHSLGFLPKDHPCARLHGHTYKLEVTVAEERLMKPWIVDASKLKRVIREVLRDYDHRDLTEQFDGESTAENIAERLVSELEHSFRVFLEGIKLVRLRLWETSKMFVEVVV